MEGIMGETFLRRVDVEQRVKLSRSEIYRRMADGTFPRPVRLAPRAVRWKASAVERWIEKASEKI